MTISDQPEPAQPGDRQGSAAPEVPRGARQAAAARRQRPVPAGQRASSRTTSTIPTRPVAPREPKTDHVTFAFIGGGFAGLVDRRAAVGGRASTTSASSRRAATSAAPGTGTAIPARSATPRRYVYMPLLEETGHMPTEKYAHAPEILEHCRRIGRQFGLYDNALFHTEVDGPALGRGAIALAASAPTAATPSPRSSSAWAPARCTCPSCPASPASRSSRATRSTPAAGTTPTPAATRRARRWTSWPTSGWRSSAPAPPRCSACRTWRAPARQLYVFQRTPSSVDVRANAPIDPEWFAEHRHARLAAALAGELHRQPGRRQRRGGPGAGRLDRPVAAHPQPGSCSCRASSARRRTCWRPSRTPTSRRWRRSAPGSTRSSQDRETAAEAQGLVPPALQAAVLPRRVPAGLQPPEHAAGRHRRQGRRADHRDGRRGRRHRVPGRLHHLRVRLRGRHRVHAARRLRPDRPRRRAAVASTGPRACARKHGIHVHGFPNAFFVQPTQGANLISNVPHNLTEAGRTIAMIVRACARQRLPAGRGDAGGRGRLGRAAADRPGPDDRLARLHARLLQQRGQEPGPAARLNVGYPGRRDGVLQVPRRMAQQRPVRRAASFAEPAVRNLRTF